MAEQVIIEFIASTEGLDSSNQKLEQQGKITHQNGEEFKKTNAEMIKQQKALEQIGAVTKKIDESGKVTRKNLADLAKIIKSQSSEFQAQLKKGIIDSLHQAGASVEEFTELLENAISPTVKQQLKELTNELERLKLAGEDNTEQYKALTEEAGKLKKALSDVGTEAKNAASDTSTLDGLIGIAQGVAGGFALAQGAAALFGDESEELQKTLLRVNSAMAILQGLQQIQLTLQKESAAATFLSTVATKAQTAAQRLFAFVVGTSSGALKVFRIALASTGIGLFILAVTTLVQKFDLFGSSVKKSADDIESLRANLSDFLDDINRIGDDAKRESDIAIAKLKEKGATDKEIYDAEKAFLERNLQLKLEAENKATEAMFAATAKERDAKKRAKIEATEEFKQLQKDAEQAEKERRNAAAEIQLLDIEFRQKEREKRLEANKKAIEDQKKAAEEAAKLAREQRQREFDEFKAGVQLQLLATQEGSREQIELRKKLLLAQLQIDLDNEKLTANQRKLLVKQYFVDRLDLEKNFQAELRKLSLENQLSAIQAELQTLEIANERKLELTEESINLSAEIEIDAANGNTAKILEINAKRDKAIRDARKASIQEILEYELKALEVSNAATVRALNRILAKEKTTTEDRIRIIDELAEIESAAVQKRIDALNEERKKGLISQKDYNLQYDILVDEQSKIWEDAEAKKTEITNKAIEERKRKTIEELQTIAQATSEVIDVLDSLFQLQSSKENDNIQRQQQELKDLQDAGAITEKEAVIRQKRLEAEEKRIRQQQAQRDKQIAVFKALLAIPQAVLQGLSQGGPILAAIYGALAAAQAAIVIARPIPKFGKGKKDNYEGPGIVGEVGAELIQKNGRMYVADKPELIWLGKSDKVFNPKETEKMLSKTAMNSERPSLKIDKKPFTIDYKKLGKEVGKNIPQTGINIDENGFREWVSKGNSFETWLNNRRSRS